MIVKKIGIILVIICSLTLLWVGMSKAGYVPDTLNPFMLGTHSPSSIPMNDYQYGDPVEVGKPVIYLYPEETTDVSVQLQFEGTIIADYPNYDPLLKGWKVTAYPDGSIVNHADGKEYSYIFWEGITKEKIDWDLSTGFVVKGEDSRVFLQQKLAEMGLTPNEYNEFIVYWYPILQRNPYNLIHFSIQQYAELAPLTISPTPDSLLRVFMVYKPLEQPEAIIEQELEAFERDGFTVVEWGGTMAVL